MLGEWARGYCRRGYKGDNVDIVFKFLSIIILLNNNLKIWLLKKLELIKIMKIKITNY